MSSLTLAGTFSPFVFTSREQRFGRRAKLITMPGLVLLRQRDRELAAIRKRIHRNLARENKSTVPFDAHESLKTKHVGSSTIGREQLSLFLGHELLATGAIFFKASRFQRSRKHQAELRGSTLVVFRNSAVAATSTVDIRAVVTVITAQHYKFDVVLKDDGYPRIYITAPNGNEDTLMYIKVTGGADELDCWRHGLARAKGVLLPSFSSLSIESVIGRGGGGRVFMVQWRENNKAYALKVIDKAQAFKSAKAFGHVVSERYIMEQVGSHPFLLQMQFAFQTESNLFIGTPFCAGGDLASYIRNKGLQTPTPPSFINGDGTSLVRKRRSVHGRLSELQTRLIAAEIVLGLEHLHSCGIVYRDLKPENIFIDGAGHVRIGDYGLAKPLQRSQSGEGPVRTGSICGTRNYLPPEMLFGRTYSFQADLWCLGVMLFRVLVGLFPFDAARTKEVFHKVKRYEPKYPAWLSAEARDLLSGLLQKDPVKRLTISGVKQHTFFKDVDWEEVLALRAGPAILGVETGTGPCDALVNFSLSKLHGVTLGEYVGEGETEPRWYTPEVGRMMVGFEYGCEADSVQPLAVKQKSGGIFSKIASIDQAYDGLAALTSRRSNRTHANEAETGPPLFRAWRSTR